MLELNSDIRSPSQKEWMDCRYDKQEEAVEKAEAVMDPTYHFIFGTKTTPHSRTKLMTSKTPA